MLDLLTMIKIVFLKIIIFLPSFFKKFEAIFQKYIRDNFYLPLQNYIITVTVKVKIKILPLRKGFGHFCYLIELVMPVKKYFINCRFFNLWPLFCNILLFKATFLKKSLSNKKIANIQKFCIVYFSFRHFS
jgi:hypothetical protein